MTGTGTSPDTLDTDFDELLAARDVMSRLRSMSSKHIFFLAQYASSRMAQELQEGQQEVEAEVQVSFLASILRRGNHG